MKKRGKGIGATFYGTGYGNGFPDVSKAVVEIDKDGKVSIYSCATEVGQGAKTIMMQIAGEVLGLGVNDINFISEDTSLTQDSGTAAASRQTYNTGNAIKLAAESMKNKLLNLAKDYLKLNATLGLEMEDHKIYLKMEPEKCVYFNQLVEKENIKVSESFTAQSTQMDEETGQGSPYWPYTFNCYGVEVEVDTETGIVEVIKGVCAQDVGRAINPELVEGQIDGGFAMGLGYAIMEDLNCVNGKIHNNKFSKYLIPTALDMIDLQKIIVEDPESTAPFGAKGIGEPVMTAVTPAILNAVYDAIGVRFYEIPITPDKVLKAINDSLREGE
ncbi:xanthine dehydrogenase family protein molybdopterin-binding subunit [Marinisporobacter balticus]|uniref:Purine hydroxylase beta subunit apoprotein n=1 Tax=Marinisporobacter balticus TaxID=2018667 RepID=A0A4R2L7P3_9FIRM|nr:molybdopterin cofactor-binding domain-containing protein [Marinisporobacter balticus]TCO75255.1 purine hydroxylase beta subunit apoprotein [Marinisporobacter balticus]